MSIETYIPTDEEIEGTTLSKEVMKRRKIVHRSIDIDLKSLFTLSKLNYIEFGNFTDFENSILDNIKNKVITPFTEAAFLYNSSFEVRVIEASYYDPLKINVKAFSLEPDEAYNARIRNDKIKKLIRAKNHSETLTRQQANRAKEERKRVIDSIKYDFLKNATDEEKQELIRELESIKLNLEKEKQ
jgi:hypothetical protein